ncbi:MAG TPA: radical SAM family heme chaperone HemW [Terracidiphilus sp.]|nr:radical SAM family heme chaperone HemW [Terracidiphilus sp.]
MKIPDDKALGLYLSIPFCRSKCTYCNFASGVYPASDHERYVERLIEDLSAAGEWAERTSVELPRAVDSVYLGGGTPSLLERALIERLFGAIRSEFDVRADAEITMECAPGQLADETLAAMAAAGVNRVSLGVQSFVDREASMSGRLHTREIAQSDIRRLREAGISNLNVDLIAGLAAQTMASWEESLDCLIDCDLPHASIYMLEVDEDSRLGREILAHGTRYRAGLVPSDEAITEMYAQAIEQLGAAGMEQYEISNFARHTFESKHNLRYWMRRPYLGLGLDASSMLWALRSDEDTAAVAALRVTTTDDLNAYLDGRFEVETHWLSAAQQHEEAWFLGLRLNSGVEVTAIEREFGAGLASEAMEKVAQLAESGLLSIEGRVVRLTERGRLFSNDVFQELVGLRAESCAAGA